MNPNHPNDIDATNSPLLPYCEACMTPKPSNDSDQFITNDNNEYKNDIPNDLSNNHNLSESSINSNDNDNNSSGSQSINSNLADNNNNNNTGSGDVVNNDNVSGGQSTNNDISAFNINDNNKDNDNTQNQQNEQNPQNNNPHNNGFDGYGDNLNNNDNDYTSSSATFSSSDENVLDDVKDDDDRERQQEMIQVPATYINDEICKLYQIYYKVKGIKPSNPNHILKYGKTVNMNAKWGEVNKFIKKNSCNYLDSLITPQALQYVSIPQMDEEMTITIKVEREDSEYYLVKGLTDNSTIHDICNKLEPRLNVISAEINLYRNNEQLSRFQAIKQLGLKDGDCVSLEVRRY